MGSAPVIASTRNPRVQAARRLRERKHRQAAGLFLLDTPHLIEEGLRAGLRWRDVFFDAGRRDHPELASLLARLEGGGASLVPATAEVVDAVAAARTPQGIVAVAALPEPPPGAAALLRAAGRRLVAFDGVQDPANVGAVLRAAWAFGAGGALLGPGTADPFHPRTLRASAGAALHLPLLEAALPPALAAARAAGWRLIALDPHDGVPPEAVAGAGPEVLVLGGEGGGISAEVAAMLDVRVRVPMRAGVESLNAAVAAAIVLYVLDRSGR